MNELNLLTCLKVVADEDTMLRTQMFPCLPAREIVRDTKMFLISFRNILYPQQLFPGLRSMETITSNAVSTTMCPRLPSPLKHLVEGEPSANRGCLTKKEITRTLIMEAITVSIYRIIEN